MITQQRKDFINHVTSEAWFEDLAKSTGREDWKQIRYVATQPDGTRVAFYQKPFIAGGRWCDTFSGAIPVEKDALGGGDWRDSLIKKPVSSLWLTTWILAAALAVIVGGLGVAIDRLG